MNLSKKKNGHVNSTRFINNIFNFLDENIVPRFNKKKYIAQQKEVKRLEMVIKSKERARAIMDLDGVIKWDNKYLIRDGIFPIGKDVKTGNLIILDFNKFANLLVGGLPGGGKTKLIQLLVFQSLKHGCKIFLADFKGGVDTIRFSNKCTVITEHQDLLKILTEFKAEIKRRINLFIEVEAENLSEYNELTGKDLKRQYLVIDELGEALEIDNDSLEDSEIKKLTKQIEKKLKSVARLGRALGCNIIAGTQRPDVTVLKGQTRSQFGCRVCFQADGATSLIVLEDNMAKELQDTPGRSIVKHRNSFIETQVFLWDKSTLAEIKNRKLEKSDLKVVNTSNQEKLDDSIADIDLTDY